MAELKTRPTETSVESFLAGLADDARRADCQALVKLMKRVTKAKPRMWGPTIVGFGSYRYKYDSGREGEWFLTGFSPRKADLTLYVTSGFEKHATLLRKLGRHKTGKSCLYVRQLADLDLGVLRQLLERSVKAPLGAKRG